MKGEKAWLQSSRSSLVGRSNSVIGNEGKWRAWRGPFRDGFPKSELNLEMDYVLRARMYQGQRQYRSRVLRDLHVFPMQLKGRAAKSGAGERAEAGRAPCSCQREFGLSCRQQAVTEYRG